MLINQHSYQQIVDNYVNIKLIMHLSTYAQA